MDVDLERFVADFLDVSRLAGMPLARSDVEVEVLRKPHRRPSRLPAGRKAVYVFATDSRCLKVGKVGANSQPRFVSQHYSPNNKRSGLAKSLLSTAPALGAFHHELGGLTADSVGAWIESNTTRIHFYVPERVPNALLSLLESFAQCRFRPLFEGGDKRL